MSSDTDLPCIIQGGMGIGVSDFRLARAVSELGGLGVVSGTAVDTVVVRRLQLGDPGGHMRRALDAFPFPAVARRIKADYFVATGVARERPLRLLTLPTERVKFYREALFVVSAFVEVYLAKQGHTGRVGINFLEKIQLPTLPSLFGAMLAGVDVVLMGAGIPSHIPGILDSLARLEPVESKLTVEGNDGGPTFTSRFEPADFVEKCLSEEASVLGAEGELRCAVPKALVRPAFLAIISSHILAKNLAKKASGRVDGFVIESHTAGGHNAPPRKKKGGPADAASPYGPADDADLAAMRELGLPFWLAGGQASSDKLREAQALGARGIQVGTAFAYCEESGITPELKQRVFTGLREKTLSVVTDFDASPTGYPFKLVVDEALPEERDELRRRERVCDLGYLRQAYVDEKGQLGFRCSGEPVDTYLKKGGDLESTKNKMCLCNGLLATVGLGQRRNTGDELPILTAGENLQEVAAYLEGGKTSYSARDVMNHLAAAEAFAAE